MQWWTGPQIARVKEMAAQGNCAQAIADDLGRTKPSIHKKARELGLRLPYPSGEDFKATTVPDYYIKAIRLLRESGLTATEISTIFKRQHRISVGYVRRICASENRADAARRQV